MPTAGEKGRKLSLFEHLATRFALLQYCVTSLQVLIHTCRM